MRKVNTIAALLCMFGLLSAFVSAQTNPTKRDSARSDKLTGGKIEKTALVAGGGNIKITLNVPAFQLTLWQNGKEVKTYFVGVGKTDYPIYIGSLKASEVIWNPVWIPPASDWVEESEGIKPGEVIQPTDPRNPLGKLKIPLGDGYLIHQARAATDLGSLVSHGCVRMVKADLYDLAEKIVMARSLPVTKKQIETAKSNSKTLAAKLTPNIPVEVTYDTHVVEGGKLHIYPDVYEYETNRLKSLRQELESSGVDLSLTKDSDLERIITRAVNKKQWVVSVASIEAGRETSGGSLVPVVGSTVVKKPVR